MIEDIEGIDPKMMQEIMEQFERIKKEAGIEPDDESEKEIEDMLGFTMGELDEDIILKGKTRTLQVKKIHPDAYNPIYNYKSDSGFDLHSVEEVNLEPLGRAIVPTGLVFGIPEEYEIQIRPKSGLALNQGLTVLNTPGTIDSGYDGEIKVIMFNTTDKQVIINKGMKIGQAVLCPVVCGKYVGIEIVENIEKRERGDNGFGSTGLF
jgi:dUTP pyrophosphatase